MNWDKASTSGACPGAVGRAPGAESCPLSISPSGGMGHLPPRGGDREGGFFRAAIP